MLDLIVFEYRKDNCCPVATAAMATVSMEDPPVATVSMEVFVMEDATGHEMKSSVSIWDTDYGGNVMEHVKTFWEPEFQCWETHSNIYDFVESYTTAVAAERGHRAYVEHKKKRGTFYDFVVLDEFSFPKKATDASSAEELSDSGGAAGGATENDQSDEPMGNPQPEE